MAEIYTESPKAASQCKLCGNTEVYCHQGHGGRKDRRRKQRGQGPKQYPTPFYFKAFLKVGWFRGDDEYLGRICKNCIKQGRLDEMLSPLTT